MLRIIISPAKKMNVFDDYHCALTTPVYLERTKELLELLKQKSLPQLQTLWQCSDKLAQENYDRLHTYHLDSQLTPALLAYEGIQYQYLSPQVFSDSQWQYVNDSLRILSGFYGILRPTDGVIPYRLEMQAKLDTASAHGLYDFWGGSLCEELIRTDDGAAASGKAASPQTAAQAAASDNSVKTNDANADSLEIINLASAEYSRAVLTFIPSHIRCVTCVFGELKDRKVKVKATQAKMARGEMVRWAAENQIMHSQDLKAFHSLNYRFQPELSEEEKLVFIRQ